MKRTHKFRAMGAEAVAVLATAPSVSAAARTLGVSRDTVHAWIRAGKVRPIGGRTRRPRVAGASGRHKTFRAWARATFDLSFAELELIDIAQDARNKSKDPKLSASVQLQAAAQFARLLRQLRLPTEAPDGDIQSEPETTRPRWPRVVGG